MAKQSLLSRLEDKSDSTRVDNFDNKSYVHPYFDDSQPSYSDPLPYTTPAFSTVKTVESKKIVLKKKSKQSNIIFWILFFIAVILLMVVIYGGLKMRGLVP